MRSVEQVRARLAEERERAARLEQEQPERRAAVARAIATDAQPSVIVKLRAERDRAEAELGEARLVVQLLAAELAQAERREAEALRERLIAEAAATRQVAEAAVVELVRQTRECAASLLPSWRAARAANEEARRAAALAGREPERGDGVWSGVGSVRAVLLELDRFIRSAPDDGGQQEARGDFMDAVGESSASDS